MVEEEGGAAEFCLTHRVQSIALLSRLSGVHKNTLNRWFVTKPKLFKLVVLGAAAVIEKKRGNNNGTS